MIKHKTLKLFIFNFTCLTLGYQHKAVDINNILDYNLGYLENKLNYLYIYILQDIHMENILHFLFLQLKNIRTV